MPLLPRGKQIFRVANSGRGTCCVIRRISSDVFARSRSTGMTKIKTDFRLTPYVIPKDLGHLLRHRQCSSHITNNMTCHEIIRDARHSHGLHARVVVMPSIDVLPNNLTIPLPLALESTSSSCFFATRRETSHPCFGLVGFP